MDQTTQAVENTENTSNTNGNPKEVVMNKILTKQHFEGVLDEISFELYLHPGGSIQWDSQKGNYNIRAFVGDQSECFFGSFLLRAKTGIMGLEEYAGLIGQDIRKGRNVLSPKTKDGNPIRMSQENYRDLRNRLSEFVPLFEEAEFPEACEPSELLATLKIINEKIVEVPPMARTSPRPAVNQNRGYNHRARR